MLQGSADLIRQAVALVTHHVFGGHFHSQLVEFIGQPERVGIHAFRSQHF